MLDMAARIQLATHQQSNPSSYAGLQVLPLEFGLLFIKLDQSKMINDIVGHEAVVMLLVDVAQCLWRVLRIDDRVTRFGGDEM